MSFKCIGVKLDGIPTDIAIGNFDNCVFIVLTQIKKFGSILSVKTDSFKTIEQQDKLYNIRTLLGVEKESADLAARYLAEQLDIGKPIIFAISLKDESIRTLRSIKQIILENKSW